MSYSISSTTSDPTFSLQADWIKKHAADFHALETVLSPETILSMSARLFPYPLTSPKFLKQFVAIFYDLCLAIFVSVIATVILIFTVSDLAQVWFTGFIAFAIFIGLYLIWFLVYIRHHLNQNSVYDHAALTRYDLPLTDGGFQKLLDHPEDIGLEFEPNSWHHLPFSRVERPRIKLCANNVIPCRQRGYSEEIDDIMKPRLIRLADLWYQAYRAFEESRQTGQDGHLQECLASYRQLVAQILTLSEAAADLQLEKCLSGDLEHICWTDADADRVLASIAD